MKIASAAGKWLGDEVVEEGAVADQRLQRHVPVPAHGVDQGENDQDHNERSKAAQQALAAGVGGGGWGPDMRSGLRAR